MDLTKITTPFGLLDEDTQKALRDSCGPWEKFCDTGDWWTFGAKPPFYKGETYRIKPQPPKPREWWISGGNCLWNTREEAEYADNFAGTVIHVVEVIE